MSAWSATMASSHEPMILKVIRTADYQYNVPSHPSGQTNPDGVNFDRVSHLSSLQEPDVLEWIGQHREPGTHIMVAFARGVETGQVSADAVYDIGVSLANALEIRREARFELSEVLRAIPGARYDHLTEGR